MNFSIQKIPSFVILSLNREKGKNPYTHPYYETELFQSKGVARGRKMDPSLALRMRGLRGLLPEGGKDDQPYSLQQILLNLYVITAQHVPELIDQVFADFR